jgi:hypothetical protein
MGVPPFIASLDFRGKSSLLGGGNNYERLLDFAVEMDAATDFGLLGLPTYGGTGI